MFHKQSIAPMVVALVGFFLTPVADQSPEKVEFSPDQAMYLATAHVSRTIIMSNGDIVVRCEVLTVKNGVVALTLKVTGNAYEKMVSSAEIQEKVKKSWRNVLENLVKMSLENAGLKKYYKGVFFYNNNSN